MTDSKNNIGDDNVIIGRNNMNVGSGNVIIDATDSNGNTILNRPMVIGRNAKGGPNDIVIGANAGSGSDLFLMLSQLKELSNNNPELAENISNLVLELKKPDKDKSKVNNLWNFVKNAVTVGNAVDLIAKITPLIISTLG